MRFITLDLMTNMLYDYLFPEYLYTIAYVISTCVEFLKMVVYMARKFVTTWITPVYLLWTDPERTNKISIYYVEGNIGSGKSTIVQRLHALLTDIADVAPVTSSTNIVFLQEPVDEWNTVRDKDNKTMLQKFYADQATYAFPFQMMAYISRLHLMKTTISNMQQTKTYMAHSRHIIIIERSLQTDRYVFAKMLHDAGAIEDVNYQIYLKWFDKLNISEALQKQSHTIYVKTSPEICYSRVAARNRSGESTIQLSYLQSCGEYHEAMINTVMSSRNTLVIDGNCEITSEEYSRYLSTISGYLMLWA